MYDEFLPPAALAGAIECFWTITGEFGQPRRNRVVPDGCADIILDLAPAAGDRRRPPGLVVGTMTRPLVGDVHGRVSLLGVRFRAGALTPLVGVNATTITDTVLPLDELWPDTGSVHDEIASLTRADRIPRLAAILHRRIAQRRERHPLIAAADALLRRSDGAIPVATLLRHLGIGARRLQRLYAAEVGTSPRFAARAYRLRRALQLLRDDTTPAARIAAQAGFFDQSHLIRDVRQLAGTTPEQYRREHRVASIQSRS
jgi:AraC-like DNA-binding protein